MARRNAIEDDTATLFMNGRSQAVRLPKAYRFAGDRVRISREGERVILEAIEKRAWPPGFWEEFYDLPPLPDDFEAAVYAQRARMNEDAERRRARAGAELARDDGASARAPSAAGAPAGDTGRRSE